MNPNRPQAQKLDSVGTNFVILAVVLGAIALGTFFVVTEVIPAINSFMNQLAQPHKSH